MISQVNVYVVDTELRLCDVYVWRSIFNIGSYDVVKKASSGICYIILFECTGP